MLWGRCCCGRACCGEGTGIAVGWDFCGLGLLWVGVAVRKGCCGGRGAVEKR